MYNQVGILNFISYSLPLSKKGEKIRIKIRMERLHTHFLVSTPLTVLFSLHHWMGGLVPVKQKCSRFCTMQFFMFSLLRSKIKSILFYSRMIVQSIQCIILVLLQYCYSTCLQLLIDCITFWIWILEKLEICENDGPKIVSCIQHILLYMIICAHCLKYYINICHFTGTLASYRCKC